MSISGNGTPVCEIDAQTEKHNRITSSRKNLFDHIYILHFFSVDLSQRAHDAIITSSLRQNDVADVILTWWRRYYCIICPYGCIISGIIRFHCLTFYLSSWSIPCKYVWNAGCIMLSWFEMFYIYTALFSASNLGQSWTSLLSGSNAVDI